MNLLTLRFFSKHQNSYKVWAQILKGKHVATFYQKKQKTDREKYK